MAGSIQRDCEAKMTLKTEIETPEMEERVRLAFEAWAQCSDFATVFEHGQWWITIGRYNYSVVDAVGGDSVDGFGFEEV